jgi:DNA-binding CsgD family transcriptional regulator
VVACSAYARNDSCRFHSWLRGRDSSPFGPEWPTAPTVRSPGDHVTGRPRTPVVTDVQRKNRPISDAGAGSTATADPELLGRVQERRRLADLLRGAREGQAGAVVLKGEPGIGKSALLEDLAENSRDFCVCRSAGVESEMEIAYAGLQQLCGPLVGRLADLPTVHRNALETVLGLSTGSPPDRFLVGVAVLDLVAMAAQERPLMWLVDDAQWLDISSRQTIGFVSRRLLGERVAIVIAARDSSVDGDLAGLPEIRLGGLAPEDAGRLFDSVVTGPTDPVVRDRIISETRGNPLALLELPRAWTAAELVEGLSESSRVPLTGRLELAFAKRLRELPADTQTLLALAAAEPKGDPALLWSAAQQLGLDWDAAAPAERAGLIEFGRHVYFRHPLVRAAAYRAAPIQQRLAVHRALADVTDPIGDADRHAWHRAHSTVTHDESIALELEQSAGRAKARGGLAAAAALLERAALLTPDGARRANRTLAAAGAKRASGALDAALQLLSSVESEPPSELRSALADRLRGKIAYDQRRERDAAELLLSAAQRLEPFDRRLARDTHFEALAAAIWASQPDDRAWIRKAAEAARAAPPSGDSQGTADLLLGALALRVTEGYETAAPMLTRALAAVRVHEIEPDEVDSLLWLAGNRAAGIMATEVWDFETGVVLARRQVKVTRESGALVQLQFALNFLANNVVLTGDIQAAAELVEEERLLSLVTGVPTIAYGSLLVAAYGGDLTSAMPMIAAAMDAATKSGQGRMVAFTHYVSSVLHNGLGRHAEALDSARRVVERDDLGYQTLVAAELAEAASREGDKDLLADMSKWVRARAAATPTEWALGIAARVEALAAEAADAADALYRESIEHLGKTPLRVELARSHLLYGEWLRRRGQRGNARDQLAVAHDALSDLGIGAFAERARREMSASTWRRTSRHSGAQPAQLTSQELQISQLVQLGLSNPEIGVRLFLSPRTVEWHLRNIFGKVGVSTRRRLRDEDLGPYLPADPGAGTGRAVTP